MLANESTLKEVVLLTDLNQLMNEADIDENHDLVQEASFFALLALISLT